MAGIETDNRGETMESVEQSICPHCNEELVARAVGDHLVVCTKCGSPLPDALMQSARLNPKAQITMMLGLLTSVLFVIAAIPALLIGVLALLEIRKKPSVYHGKGLALSGMLLASFLCCLYGILILWSYGGGVSGLYAMVTHQNIVNAGAQWKWLHPTDGVDPAESDEDFHTTFFQLDFEDESWEVGLDGKGPGAGFGYGDDLEVNIGKPKSGKRHTAYFRHRFVTKTGFKGMSIKMQRDDGIIVYLDGKEVVRDNMKSGADAYLLTADKTTGGQDETQVREYWIPGEIRSGEHVLAISLHNHSTTSSDLRLAEISLRGKPVRE